MENLAPEAKVFADRHKALQPIEKLVMKAIVSKDSETMRNLFEGRLRGNNTKYSYVPYLMALAIGRCSALGWTAPLEELSGSMPGPLLKMAGAMLEGNAEKMAGIILKSQPIDQSYYVIYLCECAGWFEPLEIAAKEKNLTGELSFGLQEALGLKMPAAQAMASCASIIYILDSGMTTDRLKEELKRAIDGCSPGKTSRALQLTAQSKELLQRMDGTCLKLSDLEATWANKKIDPAPARAWLLAIREWERKGDTGMLGRIAALTEKQADSQAWIIKEAKNSLDRIAERETLAQAREEKERKAVELCKAYIKKCVGYKRKVKANVPSLEEMRIAIGCWKKSEETKLLESIVNLKLVGWAIAREALGEIRKREAAAKKEQKREEQAAAKCEAALAFINKGLTPEKMPSDKEWALASAYWRKKGKKEAIQTYHSWLASRQPENKLKIIPRIRVGGKQHAPERRSGVKNRT